MPANGRRGTRLGGAERVVLAGLLSACLLVCLSAGLSVPLGISRVMLPPWDSGLPAGFSLPVGTRRVGVDASLLLWVLVATVLSGLAAGLSVRRGWVRSAFVLAASAAATGWVWSGPCLSLLLLLTLVASSIATVLIRSASSPLRAPFPVSVSGFTITLLLGSLVLLQTARLGTFVVDPTRSGASMMPPLHTRHSCLTGPLEAAALASNHDANPYAAEHYPDPEQPPDRWPRPLLDTRPFAVEPFVYAPQFLLVSGALLRLGGDFLGARALWFALQSCLLGLALLALVRDLPLDSRRRMVIGGLLVVLAPATLLTLQIGNAQVLAIAGSVLAVSELRRGHRWRGAALLSLAIASKLFPAVLLVHMAARRAWKDLFAVLGVLTLATGIVILWFGPTPLSSFLVYHLPRLVSGAAHPLAFAPQSLPVNHALTTLVPRILALVGSQTGADQRVHAVFGVATLGLAWWTGRTRSSPGTEAVRSLGLVSLGSLLGHISAYPYAALGPLLLLPALAAMVPPRLPVLAWLALGAGVVISVSPRLESASASVSYALVVQFLLVAISTVAILGLAMWDRAAVASVTSTSDRRNEQPPLIPA